MKLTLALAKYYTNLKLDPKTIDELVAKIGAQLGEIEEVIDLGARYKGVIVAKVMHCDDHPDASRLHVCKIDDGGVVKDVPRDEHGYVQVVCGAPNVKVGMLVAWLPPGTTVPETFDSAPFVLESRKLRGQMSHGMLASPKELGISDYHEGILEIDEEAAPGTPFADVYHLNDYIIDIENKMLTHRPDGFGVLGLYREIAGIQHKAFEGPDWYSKGGKYSLDVEDSALLPLKVVNELPKLVPRFTAIAMSGITVKPSPVWLQVELMRAGMRPVNNIVDITNFVMYLTGQPLHAYDYDKVKDLSEEGAPTLVVRHPKKGEQIILLNGKTITPRPDAMMVASDKELLCVGGAMGGANSEVDENTKNIILEAATWDMYTMRRTSMEHGIFSDAVTRFTKGQSPLQNQRVIAKAVHEVRTLAGGKVAGPLHDNKHLDKDVLERNSLHEPVVVSAEFINDRLGLKLKTEAIIRLLTNVEFDARAVKDGIKVTAPFWRTDIEIAEDVVEEVGRLYGYDHLPLELPKRDITPTPQDAMLGLKSRVRTVLAKAGANEALTYSFVHSNLLDKAGQDAKQAFKLTNALSPDLQYYRLSLTPSLLEKVHPNVKAGFGEFALFELNKIHNKKHLNNEGVPEEFESLALVLAKDEKSTGASYYHAAKYLDYLLGHLNVAYKLLPMREKSHYAVLAPFEPKRSAYIQINGEIVGVVGEYQAKVRKELKLPATCAGFELGLGGLFISQIKNRYQPLLRFPATDQDVCFKVKADVPYAELKQLVETALSKDEFLRVTVAPLDIYQRKDDTEHKQVTFRVTLQHQDRTLTTAEVNKLLETMVAAVHKAAGAVRI
ncbi:MAG: phenylalanine--tRNA ligase subunit beta [Candidatus Saccharimonadales bacterium]